MIYLKSVLAGLAALVLSAVLYFVGFSIYIIYTASLSITEGDGVVATDLYSMFASSLIPWIVVLAAFGLGFYWEFRRASH